ncbi:hypothetical protein DPMN_185455 [Dreissena polymorpha]|uniref:Uncharacterized protein n=1 Tax=Dreissena polymorpha TaxID=45954 RepID=A0A9D4DJQ5_DREPO|nr:hypothetical protein DPMN_185455 [Dreissena polymorpha]
MCFCISLKIISKRWFHTLTFYFCLTGTDAGSFDISSGKISLKSTVTLAYSTKPSYTATITGTSGSETSATPLTLYVCTGCSSTSAAVGLSIYMSVFVLAAASTKLI